MNVVCKDLECPQEGARVISESENVFIYVQTVLTQFFDRQAESSEIHSLPLPRRVCLCYFLPLINLLFDLGSRSEEQCLSL